MGDRIVIRIKDEDGHYSPDYYGHWCGTEAIYKLDQLIYDNQFNGMENLFCNFIIAMMDGTPNPYNHYVYNHGEAEGMADWDNYTWTYDMGLKKWFSTYPGFGHEPKDFCEVVDFLIAKGLTPNDDDDDE